MDVVLQGNKLPKVQVERIVGPILQPFLEEIVTHCFSENSEFSGSYMLLAPEFPLKKKYNNQSTNIDYLMFNKDKKFLLFVELKTDKESMSEGQRKIYNEGLERKFSDLLGGLEKIFKATSRKDKYQFLKDLIAAHELLPDEGEGNESRLVYLTPSPLNQKAKGCQEITFDKFPEEVRCYPEEWRIIRKKLQGLCWHEN